MTDDLPLDLRRQLEGLREKLLDLSNRNSLLNYRHPAASCLRIVDELPNVLFEKLLAGKTLVLQPVEPPSEKELQTYYREKGEAIFDEDGNPLPLKPPPADVWARQLGIAASYDLPQAVPGQPIARRYRDDRLQVLLYPTRLQNLARRMRSHARSAIEERGVNMLYLALGFLEWREEQRADRSFLAPLLLLPVQLDVQSPSLGGTQRFVIRLLNEELDDNQTLRMRLERDFGIRLPAFEAGENGEWPSPEDYFAQVEQAVQRSQPQWRVRRMATLGFFQFQRLMLYADLDAANWPDNALLDSKLVQGVLGHADLRQGLPDLPAEENDLELELVTLADSSQAKAIKAALEGRNLVIQGPPGTGKSQTITNLIAAFLARGKRVLFVAEKMAALEVVQRRLHKLGLADFCLELHSHNTRKHSIIEAIAARLQLHDERGKRQLDKAQEDFSRQLQVLRQQREELVAYLQAVHQQTSLKLPVGRVLGMAGSSRRQLAARDAALPERLRQLALPGWQEVDWHQLQQHEQNLQQLAETLKRLQEEGFDAATSPWRGISSAKVTEIDLPQIKDLLTAAAEQLQELQQAHAELVRLTGIALSDKLADVAQQPAALRQALEFLRKRQPIEAAWQVVEQLRNTLDLPLPAGWQGLRQAAAIHAIAAEMPPEVRRHLSPLVARRDFAATSALLTDQVREVRQQQAQLQELFRHPAAWQQQPQDLRDMADVLEEAGWLSWLLDASYRQARNTWQKLVRPGRDKGLDNAAQAQKLRELAEHLEELAQLRATSQWQDYFGPLFEAENTDLELLERLQEYWQRLREAIISERLQEKLLALGPQGWEQLARQAQEAQAALQQVLQDEQLQQCAADMQAFAPGEAWQEACGLCLPQPWSNWCRQLPQPVAKEPALRQAAERLQQALAQWRQGWQAVVAHCGLDEQRWSGGKDGVEALTLKELQARLQQMLQADQRSFRQWLQHDRVWRNAHAPLTQELLLWAEEGQLAPDLLAPALRAAVLLRVAGEAYRAHEILQRFDRISLEQARDRYAEMDRQLMRLRRKLIAERLLNVAPPDGQRGPRKSMWTEMALLRHEAGKKRGHRSLRNLLQQAGQSLQTLFPCFMMSPLSMAQYLPAGQVQFDVVIMDEASQLRPETCISALARCRQAVIVGDDKQMPPSRYFERLTGADDDLDDDDEGVQEDAESILELARNAFDETTLRWHYRSRHESLIRFSNHQFYDGRLIVFPSPEGSGGRYGVRLHHVSDGVYVNQHNEREAQVVAEAALQALREGQGSVGVVAMNQRQQDRIEALLFDLIQQDIALRQRLEELEEHGEPLFVKNLENVQGDERDIIIISLTYGPSTPGGKVLQRFGPINMDLGWRRLNVLFTRARERVEVYSSMRASDIVPGENRGRQVLRDYLVYAETGRLPHDERRAGDEEWPHAPQSPFEEEVITVLEAHGYEVVPQVGVDGFYIDIGVRHPQRPGAWLAGIECDGASYHGDFYMRDRDLIRQQHLEALGWRIWRIWSRDWFTDTEGETRQMLDWLAALQRSSAASISETDSETHDHA